MAACTVSDKDPAPQGGETMRLTLSLQSDIIQFLAARYTNNATLTVAEIMEFYDCPQARARRVIANLIDEGVLEMVARDTYRVTI